MAEHICPECKNPIYDDEALLCHFCGGSLKRPSKGVLGSMRYASSPWIWIMVVIAVMIGFALLVIR